LPNSLTSIADSFRYADFMSRDVQWIDADPASGERRWVCAEKFARQWRFKVKHHRRDEWTRTSQISRAMWEELLDAIERRYQRREGISEEDVAAVRLIVTKLPPDNDDEPRP